MYGFCFQEPGIRHGMLCTVQASTTVSTAANKTGAIKDCVLVPPRVNWEEYGTEGTCQ